MRAGIKRIEYALPERILSNQELEDLFHAWSAEQIRKKTGIEARHIAEEGETALDLAEDAANRLFESGDIRKSDIDFLLLATQSPDYLLPASACILQDRLGLPKQCGALDFNLGCSAYIYGLALAKSLVESGVARHVLFVTAETYSKYIYPLDRSARTIFGDGAAATLIGMGGMEIGAFDLGTDGSGKELLIVPAGGARLPRSEETGRVYEEEGNRRSKENLHMDGTGVFEFTIREVPDSVDRLLQKEKLKKDDVDLYIFHQANQFMLEFLRKKMRLDPQKFYLNFSDIGNTVSSTLPIALKRAMEDGTIKRGQRVVLSGFGVGLSWGTTILRIGGIES